LQLDFLPDTVAARRFNLAIVKNFQRQIALGCLGLQNCMHSIQREVTVGIDRNRLWA
jgi:hypothetical protein